MNSKVADMIAWCQAIANAYDAYCKGRMSREVYLAIFNEKLRDKPDLKNIEKLSDMQKCRAASINEDFEDAVNDMINGGK